MGAGEPGQGRTPGGADEAEPDGVARGTWLQRSLERATAGKAGAKPREDGLCPAVAEDDPKAAPRWPRPSRQLGTHRAGPQVAWSDYFEEPGFRVKARSLPPWSIGREARDEVSSVSSGRLSGSSGGHDSCAPSHGPWKERPPQASGPQRQPRKLDPRLEQLRDKIRAQARWQASCASLGTSVPSSASCLYKASSPVLQRKTCKVTNDLPAPAHAGLGILRASERRGKDRVRPGQGQELSRATQRQASVPRENTERTRSASYRREKAPRPPAPSRAANGKDSESVGVDAWRKGQALARSLLGPRPVRPRIQSKTPSGDSVPAVELGGKKAAAAKGPPVHSGAPRPTSACSAQQVSENTPSLASRDPPATIHTAMAVLRDLRQQIQAGLELARRPRGGRKPGPSKPRPQNLAGRRQQGPESTQDTRGSFLKAPGAVREAKRCSPDRARGFPARRPWSPWAEPESCPQRAWAAWGPDPSFQRPGSPPERLGLFRQRPWSAMAGQACPQTAWGVRGQNPSFWRPGSPPEKLSVFSQQPWSALAGQSCPQRAWTACEDWEVPVPVPWSPLERPRPALQQPPGSSFVQRPGLPCKDRGTVPSPSGAKQAWPRPTQGFPQEPPEKEQEACQPPSCPGQPHSPASLGDFVRCEARARRRQALQQKALAARTLELRNQRLQEVYQKQREAVLGKAVPVVSQKSPGIVTFVPSSTQSGGLEAPGSLGSPVLEWSKVTSGTVLGDQEAPGGFCLCLNRAWNGAESLDARRPQDGRSCPPLLLPSASSPGPLKLRDLRHEQCIHLDPWGPKSPLHFQYKQAQLRALETMADILRQRIDILTTKLQRSESPDAAGDLASDLLPSGLSMAPAVPTLTAPACLGALVPNRGKGTPQDRLDLQTRPLLPTTYFLDGDMLPWSPSWEPQSLGLTAHLARQPQGAMEEGLWELEKKLPGDSASFQALGTWARRSGEVPAVPDPTCDTLWLEETPSARAGLVVPWATRSCGQQESGEPRSGGLHDGHLVNFRLKSLSFLRSLKLARQQQARALALLRQRAEREVWETQAALNQLLFKRGLQLVEKHSAQARPEKASKPEQLQIRGGPEPMTPSLSTVTTRPRSPPGLDRDAAGSSQGPEEAGASGVGKEGSAETGRPDAAPARPALARLCPSDSPGLQSSAARPGRTEIPAPTASGHVTVAMLEQSLREEELRAQHQAALLRLREMVLEEKARAELAWLEHRRGCLGCKGHEAARAALSERQQQTLSRLEKERREIRYLRCFHLSMHRGRKQLLQHQRAIAVAQGAAARLRQELQAQTLQLQSPSPRVKAAWERGCETSRQLEATLCPPTPLRPGSSPSCHPWKNPESLKVTCLSSEQQEATPPQTSLDTEGHLQPPGPMWGEATPEASGPLAESANDVGPEPGEQPCIPLLGPLHSSSLDLGQLLGPAFPVTLAALGVAPPVLLMPAVEVEGGPAAQLSPWEAEEPPRGDPQPKPSAASAGERPLAPTNDHAWGFQGRSQPSLSRGGPCIPWEARRGEGSSSRERVDVARSPECEPQEVGSWWSEEQRIEACRQEDPGVPIPWLGAAQLAASPAPAAPKEAVPPTLHPRSPLPQLAAPLDLGSKPASRTCSGSSEAPALSPASSPRSATGPSRSSLEEFQKATATLAQLSDSSPSLSSLEAGVTPDTDPSWSGELSAHSSWEELSLPLSWAFHQGDPQPGGGPENVEQATWQRVEDSRAGPLCRSSTEAAGAGGPEPESGFLRAGWPWPLPDVPSPRSGSELSEASSQIWGEDSEEYLLEPGPGAEPASGSSLPADASSDLESSGEPQGAPLPLGPGEGQETSGTSKSMTGRSNTGESEQVSPKVARIVLPSQTPPTSDLDLPLSFPSGTSTSEGVGFSKGETMLPRALAGCWEGLQDADPSLSPTERKPLSASPEPEVPTFLQAPPEVPTGLMPPAAESQAPGCGGNGASLILKKSGPPHAGGFLSELLSPVNEELSYSSGDLPSSTQGVAHFPPPPPIPQAQSDTDEAPSSDDFPPPPKEAMFPGGSLGPLGEDTSTAEDLSSSSEEEALVEALCPGPQESGLCLGAPGQSRNLEGESGSIVGSQAVGSQRSEPIHWPVSSLSEGEGSAPGGLPRPLALLPTPSRAACVAGEGLSGDREVLHGTWWGHRAPALGLGSWAGRALEGASGSQGGPWEGVQCFEGAECQQGSGHLLDKGAVTPQPPRPAAPAVPLPGPVPLVASGQAGSLGHAGEEREAGLSRRAEDRPRPQDSLGREQVLGTDSAIGLAPGPCADLPGTGDRAVGLMSTQLSRRILCDSLAALSGLAPPGSP